MRHHCRPSTAWLWEAEGGGQGEGVGGREGEGGSKSGSAQVLHDNATRCLRLEQRAGKERREKRRSGEGIRRGYRVVATKEIGVGEELTVDYQVRSERAERGKNKMGENCNAFRRHHYLGVHHAHIIVSFARH